MRKLARTAAVLLFVSGLLVGCNQNDLGRYCFVGADDSGNTNTMALTILNTEAPECGERLCLKQGGFRCADGVEQCAGIPEDQEQIQPMCTKECSKNSDCEKSDENINGCKSFVCQRQGDETGFGDHCICVCLSFIRNSSGAPIDKATFNDEQEYDACN